MEAGYHSQFGELTLRFIRLQSIIHIHILGEGNYLRSIVETASSAFGGLAVTVDLRG